MAKCWSCGKHVSGNHYTCSSCENLSELKSLREAVESYGRDISGELYELRYTISKGLSELASAIEWGFGELSWQLQQQTEVLRSIDHTLKTPSETKANEWRLHAEELRRRGVLEESEEFFLKALNEYRLDYRIYVGLAETYLQLNKFDKAKGFLEKSLPHAPKKEIDYKSYSYRLIGHIHACNEDYSNAMEILHTSIELSPTYEEGHYDYAQYCAQMRNKEACLASLQKAIFAKPLYWYLAQKERNFDPIRAEVKEILSRISSEASWSAKAVISKAENILKEIDIPVSKKLEEVENAISTTTKALINSKDKAELISITLYKSLKADYKSAYIDAKATLLKAKDKVASGDYVALIEAPSLAEEAIRLATETANMRLKNAKNAIEIANEDLVNYRKRRSKKAENAWKAVPRSLLCYPLCFFIGGIILSYPVACISYLLISMPKREEAFIGLGGLLGLITGFIVGIYEIRGKLN